MLAAWSKGDMECAEKKDSNMTYRDELRIDADLNGHQN